MDDKELLEFAAKAAGIDWAHLPWGMGGGKIWNPLADDGDALRLAVKLDLQLGNGWAGTLGVTLMHVVKDEPDHYAATRRAIVRAAAEIGKEMK